MSFVEKQRSLELVLSDASQVDETPDSERTSRAKRGDLPKQHLGPSQLRPSLAQPWNEVLV